MIWIRRRETHKENVMKLTRISEVNREYYIGLVPDDILNDEELIILGMISDEGEPCAALAVRINGAMAYIEWLYTHPPLREQGAASEMLDVCISLLEGTNLTGVETDYPAEEYELDDFLTEYGFLTGAEQDMYRVPISDIIYSAQMDELAAKEYTMKGVVPISRLDAALKVFLTDHGMDPDCLTDISDVYSFRKNREDGEPIGCIVVGEEGPFDLKVMYLAADGALLTIESLIFALYDVMIKTGRTEGYIYFTDHLDKAIDLVEALTGQERESYRIRGRRHAVMLLEQDI
jgi:GNAT superfamily N-acetyltransferase